MTKLQPPHTCGLPRLLVATPLSNARQTKALVEQQKPMIEVPRLETFYVSFELLNCSLQHTILHSIQWWAVIFTQMLVVDKWLLSLVTSAWSSLIKAIRAIGKSNSWHNMGFLALLQCSNISCVCILTGWLQWKTGSTNKLKAMSRLSILEHISIVQ